MRKRMIAILLAGAILFTGLPVEAAVESINDTNVSSGAGQLARDINHDYRMESQEPQQGTSGENGEAAAPALMEGEPGGDETVNPPGPGEGEEEPSQSQEPVEGEDGGQENSQPEEQNPKGPDSFKGDLDHKKDMESKEPEEDTPGFGTESICKPPVLGETDKEGEAESQIPSGKEIFSLEPEGEQAESGSGESSKQEECVYPIGGYQPVEKVKISDKMAESIGGTQETELERLYGGYQYQFSLYGSQKYDSSWDIYSSNYIYNRLNAKERDFWDRLDAVCRKYLNTTADAASSQVNGGRSYYVMKEGVGYPLLGLTFQQASELYTLFTYANPQYYFIKEGYLYTDTFLFPMVYDEFARGNVRKTETAKVKSQIESMRAKVKKGADDVEKAKIAHDLIVEKVKYDPGFSFQNPQPYTPFHQSAYSVLCDDYTVCAGYTKSFSILMNSEGIDTIGVTSSMVTGIDAQGNEIRQGHAWNAVCLNDSWYYVDLTWDDRDGKEGRSKIYTFFGMSESRMTRELDPTGFHQKESYYAGLTPKCTRDFGSTADAVGTVYTPQETAAAPVFRQKKGKDGMYVSLTSATPGAEIYYTLDGKKPSSSYSRSNLYKGTFKVNSNVTVKAVAVRDGNWDSAITSESVKGKMAVVEFDTGGGKNIASQKVWPGDVVKKPANPKWKGYKFAGWYQDKKYKKKWNFNSKINKNTKIYAKWNKIKVANVSISKLGNVSGKRMTVSVQASSGADGYQIRYSTRVDMKSAKKKNTKTTKVVIDKLKTGTVYYVQVRAYKRDSAGEAVFGKWSATKAVTIRK